MDFLCFEPCDTDKMSWNLPKNLVLKFIFSCWDPCNYRVKFCAGCSWTVRRRSVICFLQWRRASACSSTISFLTKTHFQSSTSSFRCLPARSYLSHLCWKSVEGTRWSSCVHLAVNVYTFHASTNHRTWHLCSGILGTLALQCQYYSRLSVFCCAVLFNSPAVKHCLFIDLFAGYVMMLRCLCYRLSEIQSVTLERHTLLGI